MSRIICDRCVYEIEIPSDGLWFHWCPLNYWSFNRSNSKDEFSSYDEAVSAAKNDNLENYRIVKTQKIVSVVDVRFAKNCKRENGAD